MPALDLKEKMQEKIDRKNAVESQTRQAAAERVKKPLRSETRTLGARVNNNAAVDELFADEVRPEAKRFERASPPMSNMVKIVILVVALLAVVFFASAILRNKKTSEVPKAKTGGWYAVKLVNGEMYYGEVVDVATDPVVVKNVYYDYDQIDNKATSTQKRVETGNLRLVKRGKEAHGPDGTMDIVRSQVLLFEPLKEDSKVLKAILDYEK